MIPTVEDILTAQLGKLVMQLCIRDAQIAQLTDELTKLKALAKKDDDGDVQRP